MATKIKFILLIVPILGLISFQPTADDRDPNLIYWDQRALTWEDFRGHVPADANYVALTESAINMIYGSEGTNLNFVIETTFHPELSWKKDNIKEEVLKHEQGHFDITEIHSRLLKKELFEAKFESVSTIGTEIQEIFDKYDIESKEMQDKYDEETEHSIITEKQLEWDQKLADLLEANKDFASPDFSIDIAYLLK